MAKQIKPVALLTPSAATNKKNSATKTREAEPAKATAVAAGNVPAPSALPGKTLGWTAAVLLLAFILTPKPELIVYQQLNIQAKSVYWPGIFGFGAGLADSQMLVYLDDERREMRLCYAETSAVQCSKYRITHRGGLLDVGRYLLDLR